MVNAGLTKIVGCALAIAAVTLFGCAGPPPNHTGEGRRGPPPFEHLDLNQDGRLTMYEFQSHEIPHGDHDAIFRSIDANADGVITQSEYEGHRPPPGRAPTG